MSRVTFDRTKEGVEMELSAEFLHDIEFLNLYNLNSALEGGVKIHHEANPRRVASAQRLFEAGLLTQNDGGYLTMLGVEVAEHAQAIVRLLPKSKSEMVS